MNSERTTSTDKATVIDVHADVEGQIRGKDAQILGRFRGQIELTGRLLLGEGSRVNAKVVADVAELAGDFKGEVKARSLVLLEKARVEGTVDVQSIAVREGALLNGAVNVGGSARSGGAPQPSAGIVAG